MSADQLIIFDCDGVLVDSEPIANAVFAQHLTAIGLPTTPAQAIERFKGRSLKSALEMVAQDLGRPVPATFLDEMQAQTYRQFRTQLNAVDGAEDLVKWAQGQGFRTCIASSGDYEKMDVTLGLTGLKRYFEGRIFSSLEVKRGKPAPDLFLYAAQKMGVLPAKCTVIEDSQAGVDAALAAGMRVFAYGDFPAAPGVVPVSRLLEIRAALSL
ncbi:MAG: HAD family phosphatase [Pseudomonadota bacterium]